MIGEDLYYRKHYETLARRNHFLCKQFRDTFVSKNQYFIKFLYQTYVLPKLEYASSMWSPYYKKDVDLIGNVQRKFTKFLPGMFNVSYQERLHRLNMQTLEERRIYLDLILLFKIYHGIVDIDFNKYCSINQNPTRGHPLKLNFVTSRVNCHKHHFFNRIVKIWNAVPAEIVTLTSLIVLKKCIYSFNVKSFCIGRAFT